MTRGAFASVALCMLLYDPNKEPRDVVVTPLCGRPGPAQIWARAGLHLGYFPFFC